MDPILPVVTYSDDAEIEDIIERNPEPLAFYIFFSKAKTDKISST
ncbi:MAG: hypothetical protein R2771_13845 [Saprospiraceae bacterium]